MPKCDSEVPVRVPTSTLDVLRERFAAMQDSALAALPEAERNRLAKINWRTCKRTVVVQRAVDLMLSLSSPGMCVFTESELLAHITGKVADIHERMVEAHRLHEAAPDDVKAQVGREQADRMMCYLREHVIYPGAVAYGGANSDTPYSDAHREGNKASVH